MKRQMQCGDFVESQYYNTAAGLKGKRFVTKDICAICYENDDIISADEIRRNRDVGGKNPLLVCRFCFDTGVEIPCSGGRTNSKQKRDQKQATKRKELDESVQAGRRKSRKE